ncbi:MAG: hypothetical protein LUI87_03485 [Lachnospiraceae bacterium]|nr:hypothetical protein [Lachnospiraceae bacterium]
MNKQEDSQILKLMKALDAEIEIEAQGMYERLHDGEASSILFPTMIPIETLEETARPRELIGKKGVYAFVLKNDCLIPRRQIRQWMEVKSAGFKHENKDIEGDCLYVGSCVSKSLYVRLAEHVGNKGISALSLSHPKRVFLKPYLICYAFPIDKSIPKEYYKYCLPQIERKLHDKLEPVAGSSRT